MPVEGEVEAVEARLVAAGCVAAAYEAALFVEAASDRPTLEAWLRRRERGEPPAWITGRSRFCGLLLHVDPGVYVPRVQSESLAERAAARLPPGGRAVDLCTGTGAVAAHLRAHDPTATVVGFDLDPVAVGCARRNGVPAAVADLGDAVRDRAGLDVVTAVAPYVPTGELRLLPADVQRHEPRVALDGGVDGLALVTRVVAAAARTLRPRGWLVVEVGGDQDVALGPRLERHGFAPAIAWRDEDGDLRGLAAQLEP